MSYDHFVLKTEAPDIEILNARI